jgi:hypothetical protein
VRPVGRRTCLALYVNKWEASEGWSTRRWFCQCRAVLRRPIRWHPGQPWSWEMKDRHLEDIAVLVVGWVTVSGGDVRLGLKLSSVRTVNSPTRRRVTRQAKTAASPVFGHCLSVTAAMKSGA